MSVHCVDSYNQHSFTDGSSIFCLIYEKELIPTNIQTYIPDASSVILVAAVFTNSTEDSVTVKNEGFL